MPRATVPKNTNHDHQLMETDKRFTIVASKTKQKKSRGTNKKHSFIKRSTKSTTRPKQLGSVKVPPVVVHNYTK